MERPQKRRPRFRRISEVPTIRLTERDRAVLRHVEEHRFLRTSHILRLVPGSAQNLRRRLQKLYHHGFLDRPRSQLPYLIMGELTEMVHGLDRRGAEAIDSSAFPYAGTARSENAEALTGLFLAHTLSVSDVMVAFETAYRSPAPLQIIKATDLDSSREAHEPAASPFRWHVTVRANNRAERIGLVPDAVFALERSNEDTDPHRSYYFLEVDRGTMPVKRQSLAQSSIYRKALAYIETRRSGVVKERFGIPAFRVLFVTKSHERMRNMMLACREANDGRDSSMMLFSTQDKIREAKSILSLPWSTTSGESVFVG